MEVNLVLCESTTTSRHRLPIAANHTLPGPDVYAWGADARIAISNPVRGLHPIKPLKGLMSVLVVSLTQA